MKAILTEAVHSILISGTEGNEGRTLTTTFGRRVTLVDTPSNDWAFRILRNADYPIDDIDLDRLSEPA